MYFFIHVSLLWCNMLSDFTINEYYLEYYMPNFVHLSNFCLYAELHTVTFQPWTICWWIITFCRPLFVCDQFISEPIFRDNFGLIMIMKTWHFYSATLSTTTQRRSQLQHGYFIGVSRRSAQATAGKGLSQGPYMVARAGVEPTTLRLKAIDSTKAPPCPTICSCEMAIVQL